MWWHELYLIICFWMFIAVHFSRAFYNRFTWRLFYTHTVRVQHCWIRENSEGWPLLTFKCLNKIQLRTNYHAALNKCAYFPLEEKSKSPIIYRITKLIEPQQPDEKKEDENNKILSQNAQSERCEKRNHTTKQRSQQRDLLLCSWWREQITNTLM